MGISTAAARGDRHRRRLLRPHADALRQARGHRSDDQGQGRLARRSASHGRGRGHLLGQAWQGGPGRPRPASAATATFTLPMDETLATVAIDLGGRAITWSSTPNSPRQDRRLRQRTGRRFLAGCATNALVNLQSWSTTAATAITSRGDLQGHCPSAAGRLGTRPADHRRAEHQRCAVVLAAQKLMTVSTNAFNSGQALTATDRSSSLRIRPASRAFT